MKKTTRSSSDAMPEADSTPSKGIALKAIGAGQNVANTLIETNRSIWLAGLGAFASLGRKASDSLGSKSFDELVKAGEAMEMRSKALVDTSANAAHKSVDSIAERLDTKIEEFENVFDARIASALHRLNIPTRGELAVLMHRIETLEAEIKTLRGKSK